MHAQNRNQRWNMAKICHPTPDVIALGRPRRTTDTNCQSDSKREIAEHNRYITFARPSPSHYLLYTQAKHHNDRRR